MTADPRGSFPVLEYRSSSSDSRFSSIHSALRKLAMASVALGLIALGVCITAIGVNCLWGMFGQTLILDRSEPLIILFLLIAVCGFPIFISGFAVLVVTLPRQVRNRLSFGSRRGR